MDKHKNAWEHFILIVFTVITDQICHERTFAKFMKKSRRNKKKTCTWIALPFNKQSNQLKWHTAKEKKSDRKNKYILSYSHMKSL